MTISSPVVEWLLLVAGLIGAVTAIYKGLHVGEIVGGTRDFLRSWNGEEARPGYPAAPSFPERMAAVEASLLEVKDEARHAVDSASTAAAQAIEARVEFLAATHEAQESRQDLDRSVKALGQRMDEGRIAAAVREKGYLDRLAHLGIHLATADRYAVGDATTHDDPTTPTP